MPIRKFRGRKSNTSRNTRRENRIEELGRVDAERADTAKGKRNLRQEKYRIRKELAVGGSVPKAAKKLGAGAGKLASQAPKPKGAWDQPHIKKLIERLQQLRDKQKKAKVSPQRPGGKGPKPDKRWNKGDKFMTPLKRFKGGGRAKGPNRPRPTGPHMWVRGDKRKKYASGGVVMAGKKVGCQIK